MRFMQHIPNFISTDERIDFEFSDFEKEVLDHPWIKHWSEDPNFCRYSWSPNNGQWSKAVLMVELKGGTEWWVIGYLDIIPNLPEWKSNDGSAIAYLEQEEKKR